jgi:exopolysaccharide biosynthesis polyprenyl glycosylphosphotransferase
MHKRNLLKKLILLGGDAVLIAAAFYFAPALRFGTLMDFVTIFELFDIASILIYLTIFYVSDLYALDVPFRRGIYIIRFGIALVVANIFIAMSFFLFRISPYSVGVFLLVSCLIFFFCMGWRIIFERLALHTRRPLRLAVLGAGEAGHAFYEMSKEKKDYEVAFFLDDDEKKWGSVVGSAPVMGRCDLLLDFVREKKIDAVIIAFTNKIRPEVYRRIIAVKFSGVNVYEMATFWEMTTGDIPVNHVSDVWLTHATMSCVQRTVYTRRAKRVIDIILSLMGLLVTFPLVVVIFLAVRLDSPGPALFVQRRTGWQGRPFNMLKIRTMRVRTEIERDYAGHRHDPRITRVGRVLRLFRLDELPQLWNVLKGEMSFIGPRALMEEEVIQFNPEIPYFNLRHTIRPGITGWAQVNYRHGATKEDALKKLQYDLYYLKNMSLILDLHILLRTVRVVLFCKGAR